MEAGIIKETGIKEEIRKRYLWRTRKLIETKLFCRHLTKGINTWATPLVRYPGQFLKKIREENTEMDQKKKEETDNDVEGLTPKRWHTDISIRKRRKNHWVESSKQVIEKLQQPVAAMAMEGQIEKQQNLKIRNTMKKINMYTSNDKLAKWNTRRHEHDYVGETTKEKVDPFNSSALHCHKDYLKRESIIHNRMGSVGYVEAEMKRSITL